MFTLDDAKRLGWTLDVVGENGAAAWKSDDPKQWVPDQGIHVTSATPLFSLLANIAEREGVGFLQGYGGEQPLTAELVRACSGETLAPSPPPTPEEVAFENAIANEQSLRDKVGQAIGNLETAATNWGTLTAAQKDAAAKLTVQVTARLARLALRHLDAAP